MGRRCGSARVTGADPALNELRVRTLDERDETLRYDQLIVALGSVSRVLPSPASPSTRWASRRSPTRSRCATARS